MRCTEELAEKLMEELNCDTVFTIPLFGGIPVAESTVVTWIIMAGLVLLSIPVSYTHLPGERRSAAGNPAG